MKSLPLKILLAALLLIASLLAVAPKIIGLGIEQATVDSLLLLMPQETESQIEVRRNEFSQGWFGSTAAIELLYTPLGSDAIALTLDFEIDHGPLLLTPDGLRLGSAYATITPGIRNELFDVTIADGQIPLPRVGIELFAGFDASLQLALHVAALDYHGSDGEIGFAGLEARIDVAPDQSANFLLEMGELSATETAANSNIVVAGMNISSSTARINDMLAASSASLSIPTISSTAPLPFTVSGIGIDWSLQASSSQPESSEIHQTIAIESIESEIPLNALRWDSEVKQLKNELLRDYYRLLSEFQYQYSADPETESVELGERGQALYLLALQNPLELNNLLEFRSYGGDHSAQLRVLWAGVDGLSDVDELDTSTLIAAQNITFVISLDLDAVLRSPFAGLVDPYTQQGYLTVTNGRVMVEGSLVDSVLRLNGDELPLEQFLQ